MKPAEALQANQEKHWFCVTRAFLVQSPSLWSLRSATFLMKQRRNQEQAQDVPHAPAPEWGGTDTAVSAAQEQHRIIPKQHPTGAVFQEFPLCISLLASPLHHQISPLVPATTAEREICTLYPGKTAISSCPQITLDCSRSGWINSPVYLAFDFPICSTHS